MTDDAELEGLDPADLLDAEAARLEAFFSELPAENWARDTRCELWTVRDLLGHLAAGEEYHHACLEGRVADLLAGYGERGAVDLDGLTALGVADYADHEVDALVEEWRAANAETRSGFRERGDGTVDTSVGDYPARWQAFHVACELATHADDLGVPVTAEEREARLSWRVRFSRFALGEAKPHLSIEMSGSRTRVSDGTLEVELGDEELVDAVMARLDESSDLDSAVREMLSAS